MSTLSDLFTSLGLDPTLVGGTPSGALSGSPTPSSTDPYGIGAYAGPAGALGTEMAGFNLQTLPATLDYYSTILGGNDRRFAAYEAGQTGLLAQQRAETLGQTGTSLARHGVGGSAGINEMARQTSGLAANERAVLGGIDLQQMQRQDQANAARLAAESGGAESIYGIRTAGVGTLATIPALGIAATAATKAGTKPSSTGLLGTVICSVMFAKGLISKELFEADKVYGARVNPTVLAGYHLWAKPLALRALKSDFVLECVSPWAIAWAKHMAYKTYRSEEDNFVGRGLHFIGYPLCFVLGIIPRLFWR